MNRFAGIKQCIAFENLKDTLERLGIMENNFSGRVYSQSVPLTREIIEEAAEKAKENFGRP